MKNKTGTAFILALGIMCLSTGLALAQATGANVGKAGFTDNPSPFPFVHSGLGGSGTLLSGGQLITSTGTMGSGDFFMQEFVNVNGGQLAIHSILESTPVANGPSFVQEDFVLMGSQRSPVNQNNTVTPTQGLPPSHGNIAFRQLVTDAGFSTTGSLDPGQDIHIHQQVASSTAVVGQTGGLTFSNVDILPNKVTKPGDDPGNPSCGNTAAFCTTLAQEVRQADGSFTQNINFTTGSNPTIIQNP